MVEVIGDVEATEQRADVRYVRWKHRVLRYLLADRVERVDTHVLGDGLVHVEPFMEWVPGRTIHLGLFSAHQAMLHEVLHDDGWVLLKSVERRRNRGARHFDTRINRNLLFHAPPCSKH